MAKKVKETVTLISLSADRKRAQIVKHDGFTSVTRHALFEADGKYHYRQFNDKGECVLHEEFNPVGIGW